MPDIEESSLNILTHTHKYGSTLYPFWTPVDIEDTKKVMDFLVKHFEIDYDEETETLDLLMSVQVDNINSSQLQ